MNEAGPLYQRYIINIVINAFSAYSAIMLNILTIHAMRKTPSLPKPLKTLLLSLAVSDLGVGLLAQPLYIACMVSHTHFTKIALAIVAVTLVNASFFSIVALSVDRFLAIHLHLKYQELVTHKRVVAVVISIWVFSALLSSIWLWIQPVHIATLVDTIIQTLCFVCTSVIYYRIYLAVRRHRYTIHALQVQLAHYDDMAKSARHRKSALSTLHVYLVFLVCYFPNYCAIVARMFTGPNVFLDGLLLYLGTLMLVNSSLNPVIYCWKMRHIRHAILDILRGMLLKLSTRATTA